MSAQRGSGRPPSPPELRRTESVRLMLRAGEAADLAAVAEAWGVPVATVVWAIVHERIAKARREPVELGEYGIAITVGLQVTRRASKGGSGDPTASSR